ncbi:hypothetical protein ACF0H5_022017 [Mactra antiquata]
MLWLNGSRDYVCAPNDVTSPEQHKCRPPGHERIRRQEMGGLEIISHSMNITNNCGIAIINNNMGTVIDVLTVFSTDESIELQE